MCGIIGYIGNRPAKDILFDGLKRLEYRGYDSSGIAVIDKHVTVAKAVGDTSSLILDNIPVAATIGIGHTRWATHGRPSVQNAHPHTFGDITIVHNGIIDNYQGLKASIDSQKLQSQTDTEVLAALIDSFYQKDNNLLRATKAALTLVQGTFGLVVISAKAPDEIITARRGSPIVIGVGPDQYYVASDPSAIIDQTNKVVYLKDDQVAKITREALSVYDLKLQYQPVGITELDNFEHSADLGHFESYLEKEIFEQPQALLNLMRGRVSGDGLIVLGGPNLSDREIRNLDQILIIGCGTSYYAGHFAKYQLEEMLGRSIAVEHASEFRYRFGAYNPQRTLAIFLSQSGETADTLAALKEAKRRRIPTMGIVNVVGSTLAREVDHGGIYLHAGLEISVASTKVFTSMSAGLLMFGGFLAHKLGLNQTITRHLSRELLALPGEIEATLALKPQIERISSAIGSYHDWFYLGRNNLHPIAQEGALKLSEVAYVHAQAFPAGEMKHGPISLIDQQHLSVVLLPEDELLYDKGLSTLQEIKARGGKILSISTRPKPFASDYHLQVAHLGNFTDGLIYNVCLQLLALAVASSKNVNIDKPRNLAKSVTVE